MASITLISLFLAVFMIAIMGASEHIQFLPSKINSPNARTWKTAATQTAKAWKTQALHENTTTEKLTHELDTQASKLSDHLREFLANVTNETIEDLNTSFPFYASTYVTSEEENFMICEKLKPIKALKMVLGVLDVLNTKVNKTTDSPNSTSSPSSPSSLLGLNNFYYRIDLNPWKKEKLSKCIKKASKLNVIHMELGHHLSLQMACFNRTMASPFSDNSTTVTTKTKRTTISTRRLDQEEFMQNGLSNEILLESDLAFGERYEYDDLTGNSVEHYGGGFQWNLLHGKLRIQESRIVTKEKELILVFETKEALADLLKEFTRKTQQCYKDGTLQVQLIHGGGWNEKIVLNDSDEDKVSKAARNRNSDDEESGVKEIVVGYGIDVNGYSALDEIGKETAARNNTHREKNETSHIEHKASNEEKNRKVKNVRPLQKQVVSKEQGGNETHQRKQSVENDLSKHPIIQESHSHYHNATNNATEHSSTANSTKGSVNPSNSTHTQPKNGNSPPMHVIKHALHPGNQTAPAGNRPLLSNTSIVIGGSYRAASADCLKGPKEQEEKLCILFHQVLGGYMKSLHLMSIGNADEELPDNDLKAVAPITSSSSSVVSESNVLAMTVLTVLCIGGMVSALFYFLKTSSRRYGYSHIDRADINGRSTRSPFSSV